ncbi:MAG: hypothetical protein PVF90_10675, partial [Gemmatimonadota bacterium]
MRYTEQKRASDRAVIALILGLTVGISSGCKDLLDVELPHLLTNDAIADVGSAETQVNSAIALFECGYSEWTTMSLGPEDAMQSIAGVGGGTHGYDHTPNTGECDSSSSSTNWFDNIVGARALLTTQPSRLVASAEGTATSDFPAGKGVYDRIQDEWGVTAVPAGRGEILSAISAIYVAASLGHLGEFVCESAIGGSELLTPGDMLGLAEDWVGTALGHIAANGDFAMPFGVAPSAENMAYAMRARFRWANGDVAQAAADAAQVLAADPDFTAYVTRETGQTRRNKSYHMLTDISFSAMLGINDWWDPAIRSPNPVTGQPWPDPIPFTGYLFLGIMPDGRTLEAGNLPVRWAEEERDAAEQPVSLGNGAVPDTRVPHIYKSIQGPGKHEVPYVYTAEDDDIPYMTWEELKLIQADNELLLGAPANLQNAIDLVNELRVAKSLPEVSGAYLATLTDGTDDFDEVRYLLLEERRREFFAEGGRYWSTKIQNTDVLWFPRLEGATPFQGYNLQGAVRQLFATDEYQQNPNFVDVGGLDARGT